MLLAWWDGEQWTAQTQPDYPRQQMHLQMISAQSSAGTRNLILGVIVVVILVGGIYLGTHAS